MIKNISKNFKSKFIPLLAIAAVAAPLSMSGLNDAHAAVRTNTSSSTISITAHSSFYQTTGALFRIAINGQEVVETYVGSTAPKNYSYTYTRPLTSKDTVEIFFTNDAAGNGEDRNLYIDSLKIGGVSKNASDAAVYDQGTTWAEVRDGVMTHSGKFTLPWSGALRFGPVLPKTSTTNTTVPAVASAAGFTKTAFSDDFNSMDSIDTTGNGFAGKKWFIDRPWGTGVMDTSGLSVSNGILNFDQKDNAGPNMGISTVSTKNTTVGQSFRYGYYEAKIKFNPANFTSSTGWPSFWLMSTGHVQGTNNTKWSEIDAMEMYHNAYQPFDSTFFGSVWDHSEDPKTGVQTNIGNTADNQYRDTTKDWSDWHTYGLLWQKGKLTWYVDGKAVVSETYSSTTTPNPNNNNNPVGTYSVLDDPTNSMDVILGTGSNNPMQVDYVKVYSA